MITVKKAAELGKVSERYVRNEIASGRLKAEKPEGGRDWIIDKESFEAWLAKPLRGSRARRLPEPEDYKEFKVWKSTPLYAIKERMAMLFDIQMTNAQAGEIRDSVCSGLAVWSDEKYVSTSSGDDIRHVTAEGVRYGAYQTFYTTEEWNQAVRTGSFR